jgi:hypothetical protein
VYEATGKVRLLCVVAAAICYVGCALAPCMRQSRCVWLLRGWLPAATVLLVVSAVV